MIYSRLLGVSGDATRRAGMRLEIHMGTRVGHVIPPMAWCSAFARCSASQVPGQCPTSVSPGKAHAAYRRRPRVGVVARRQQDRTRSKSSKSVGTALTCTSCHTHAHHRHGNCRPHLCWSPCSRTRAQSLPSRAMRPNLPAAARCPFPFASTPTTPVPPWCTGSRLHSVLRPLGCRAVLSVRQFRILVRVLVDVLDRRVAVEAAEYFGRRRIAHGGSSRSRSGVAVSRCCDIHRGRTGLSRGRGRQP
jgi:hypothetical protein